MEVLRPMQSAAFWSTVTKDDSGFLPEFVEILEKGGIRYAGIGGQAVNAYVDPLVSLDLDLVVEESRRAEFETELRKRFRVEIFEHSVNVSKAGSDLRVQLFRIAHSRRGGKLDQPLRELLFDRFLHEQP